MCPDVTLRASRRGLVPPFIAMEVLRAANEPARHKVLDLVGDLALVGHDLRGHVVAYRSGHPLNVELARALCRRLPLSNAAVPAAA